MLYIYTEDPLNPSLDPATRLYGWRYLSLHPYCCYICIYIYITTLDSVYARYVFRALANMFKIKTNFKNKYDSDISFPVVK